jgi:ABC-type thiamine transport system ATPase subunit
MWYLETSPVQQSQRAERPPQDERRNVQLDPALARFLGIKEYERRAAAALSGGQRTAALIARTPVRNFTADLTGRPFA